MNESGNIQPSPYECAVNGHSSIIISSPYESAAVNTQLDPTQTECNGDQSGCRSENNLYTEQHVYEDADKYFM